MHCSIGIKDDFVLDGGQNASIAAQHFQKAPGTKFLLHYLYSTIHPVMPGISMSTVKELQACAAFRAWENKKSAKKSFNTSQKHDF